MWVWMRKGQAHWKQTWRANRLKPQKYPQQVEFGRTKKKGPMEGTKTKLMTLLPKSWLRVHQCQKEIRIKSLEEIGKSSFIIFARPKGSTAG